MEQQQEQPKQPWWRAWIVPALESAACIAIAAVTGPLSVPIIGVCTLPLSRQAGLDFAGIWKRVTDARKGSQG